MENAPSRRLPCLWIIAAVLAALLLIAFFTALVGPKIPVYQNKNLYAWAEDLQIAQQNYSDPERWKKIEAAATAIRAIGTNALPFVMADLRARVTIKVRVVNWLAPRARFLKLQPIKVGDRWRRGIRALEALGPIAKPCLPELITLTRNTGYTESALMALGPDAIPAFTNLLSNSKFPQTGNLIGAFVNAVYANRIHPDEAAVALPCLLKVFRSSDMHGRWYAASALGAIHAQPDVCIPLLIEELTNSFPSVRSTCIEALGYYGPAAAPYSARLAQVFDETDLQTRQAICGTFGNFYSSAEVVVPVLVRGLTDINENVRFSAASSLGRIGQYNHLPDEAVSRLIVATSDRHAVVRMVAIQSLGQLNVLETNEIAAIHRACMDRDPSVRTAATNALKRLSF
jgi:hypothetical protein